MSERQPSIRPAEPLALSESPLAHDGKPHKEIDHPVSHLAEHSQPTVSEPEESFAEWLDMLFGVA